MRNLVPVLLPHLEANRLRGLDAGPGSIYPFYDGYSLANLPSSVCRWLGVPGFGSPALDAAIFDLYPRSFQKVVLIIVDGMGLNTLESALQMAQDNPDFAVWAELAEGRHAGEEGALAPLTSVAPSTTAAALTTFWTGRPPAEHGVVGYEVWLKEYGIITNMLKHSPASYQGDIGSLRNAGFNPDTFLPIPTLGPHLRRYGIRPAAFQHHSIARSGLSNMLLKDVDVFPFGSLSDLWVTLGDLLDASADERSLLYAYWGDLDEHSHRFGPGDRRVELELASFSRQLGYFIHERRRAPSRGKTLLLITADHGHISTPRLPEFELRSHPDLLDTLVMLPSGEARLPFVFLRSGREERFLRYLEDTWPGQFLPVPSTQVIESGLFGGQGSYARLPDRVGDYVIFPQNGAYWWFGAQDNPLLGRHGGLSRIEMQIPLFAAVI